MLYVDIYIQKMEIIFSQATGATESVAAAAASAAAATAAEPTAAATAAEPAAAATAAEPAAAATGQPTDYLITCPHCGHSIQIPRDGINCQIFRHGVYRADPNTQIPPHSSREECDRLVAENLIYGCGRPFIFRGGAATEAEICDYI
jgi:hypothetical protein